MPSLKRSTIEIKNEGGVQLVHGVAISELQNALLRHGYSLNVNGIADQDTVDALIAFKKSQGLPPTTRVDRKTWALLLVLDRPVLRIYDGFDHVSPHLRDAVRELQALLIRQGFQMTLDGRFNVATDIAVKQIQEIHGLPIDGIVNQQVWAALLQVQWISPLLKDVPEIQSNSSEPKRFLRHEGDISFTRRRLAETYNRLGGTMEHIAYALQLPVVTVLALYHVQGGGRRHDIGKALIRFENHYFYKNWGRFYPELYNQYFRHGGYNGEPGQPWQQHRFRTDLHDTFRSFHGNLDLEYTALQFAEKLANDPEPALLSVSIGNTQILVSNYRLIGYTSAYEMYETFQNSEKAQLVGFFDFCNRIKTPEQGALINALRDEQWQAFIERYNGPVQAEAVLTRLLHTLKEAQSLLQN